MTTIGEPVGGHDGMEVKQVGTFGYWLCLINCQYIPEGRTQLYILCDIKNTCAK